MSESELQDRGEATGGAQIKTFLIADIRGYTLFTQERGDEAGGKLAARFADLSREVVESRGGTLLELRGDEALCVFDSAREAIRAAVELQERFVDATLDEPELPLTVGIGLDAGEAVPVQGGYRGGALNLAARLCGQARAGEILASREVTHLARRVDGVRYEDRGSLALKGLVEPVAIQRVVPEAADPVERLRPFTPPAPRGRWVSKRWAAIGAIVVVLALVALALPRIVRPDASADFVTDSVARLNADGGIDTVSVLGKRPGSMAVGSGGVWVTEPDLGVVAQLDAEDGSVVDPSIQVGASPAGVAVGEGSVWVTNEADGTVSRIDPETGEVSETIDAGSGPSGISVGDGALWIADALTAELHRVDLVTRRTRTVPLGGPPSHVTYTPEGVWVSEFPAMVERIDPISLESTLSSPVGSGPTAVTAAFGSVWVANHLDATISRIEPTSGRNEATIAVGEGPNALAATEDGIWVANELDGSITEVDPTTNAVRDDVEVGAAPAALATDGDALWLAVGASPAEHRGGTFRVTSAGDRPVTLDPGVVFDTLEWAILSVVHDGLITYKKVGGPDGATLVPDLASALPDIGADGLTYRFPLRTDVRYTTGDPVRPEDFLYGLERSLTISPGIAELYAALEGVDACVAEPSSCDLSDAIEYDDESVTFHLAAPDSTLLYKLALPFAAPIPDSVPKQDLGLEPIPSTGPYRIGSSEGNGLVLERNPTFEEWSRGAQPAGFVDEITFQFGEPVAAGFERLRDGAVDWMVEQPDPQDIEALQGESPDQVVVASRGSTVFLGFDVRQSPFDDPRVRRALSYALDRDHMIELLGGPNQAVLTCQILPPNFEGYERHCPYTTAPDAGEWTAPDLETARLLIEQAEAEGAEVAVWVAAQGLYDGSVDVARYVTRVLEEDLGMRPTLTEVDEQRYFGSLFFGPPDPGAPGYPDLFVAGWIFDYPGAGGFIDPQFRCGAPANISGVCSRAIDEAIDEAMRLGVSDPGAAARAWTQIEHRLIDDAQQLPFANQLILHAFSERTDNIQVHPQWGLLLSRLWVQ